MKIMILANRNERAMALLLKDLGHEPVIIEIKDMLVRCRMIPAVDIVRKVMEKIDILNPDLILLDHFFHHIKPIDNWCFTGEMIIYHGLRPRLDSGDPKIPVLGLATACQERYLQNIWSDKDYLPSPNDRTIESLKLAIESTMNGGEIQIFGGIDLLKNSIPVN